MPAWLLLNAAIFFRGQSADKSEVFVFMHVLWSGWYPVSWYTLALGALLTFPTFSFHLKLSDKCQRIPQSMSLGTQAGGRHLFPGRNQSQRKVWGMCRSPWNKHEWIKMNESMEMKWDWRCHQKIWRVLLVFWHNLHALDRICSLYAKVYFCDTCGRVPILPCGGDYCAKQCCPSGGILLKLEWIWILRRALILAIDYYWLLNFLSG